MQGVCGCLRGRHARFAGVRLMSSAAEPSIISKVQGNVVMLTLNRPKALNALNLEMIRTLAKLIPTWDKAAAVVMKGAGGRAFCAGGDIKQIAEGGSKPGGHPHQDAFFREEYTVDYALAQHTKSVPHVILEDGVIMGGGVGISINASFRVATEKSMFAMPETAIGFFPDVGGSYFLPRLPQPFGLPFGMFLGLTGHRLTGADLVHTGLATHFVQVSQLPAVEAALSQLPPWSSAEDAHRAVAAALSATAIPAGDKRLPPCSVTSADVELINSVYSAASVEEIVAKTQAAAGSSALMSRSAAALGKMSPTSLKITHEQILRGAKLNLAECFQMELRMGLRVVEGTDFYEGVRALLVDKDNKPQWSPSSLSGVTSAMVQAHFAPVAGRELRL